MLSCYPVAEKRAEVAVDAVIIKEQLRRRYSLHFISIIKAW